MKKKKRLVSSKADKKDYFDTCCDMSHDFSENGTFWIQFSQKKKSNRLMKRFSLGSVVEVDWLIGRLT